jgi:hypothetical protein
MSTTMNDASSRRDALSRRSMEQASNDFNEVVRLADTEQSVVVTSGGKDRLIVLRADHARALIDRLEQATAKVVASSKMHDRGGTPELAPEAASDIANLRAAVEDMKSLMHDRG